MSAKRRPIFIMAQLEDIFELLKAYPSSDPLSEMTRKERRYLLVTSLISMAITWGGIIPEKISAFGIQLSSIEQRRLLLLICGIIVYFLAGFLIYGIPEYLQSQAKEQVFRGRLGRLLKEYMNMSEADTILSVDSLLIAAKKILGGRKLIIVFDFIIPVLLAFLSIDLLISKSFNLPFFSTSEYYRSTGVLTLLSLIVFTASFFTISIFKRRKRNKPIDRIVKQTKKDVNELHEILDEFKELPENSPEREAMRQKFDEKVRSMGKRDGTPNAQQGKFSTY